MEGCIAITASTGPRTQSFTFSTVTHVIPLAIRRPARRRRYRRLNDIRFSRRVTPYQPPSPPPSPPPPPLVINLPNVVGHQPTDDGTPLGILEQELNYPMQWDTHEIDRGGRL
ncbi:unnamed protein product, partial [Adineta steineri]